MKVFVSMCALSVVGIQAFAAQRQVPGDQVPQYVQAVDLAMQKSKIECQGSDDGLHQRDTILASTSVVIDPSGAQPSLVMTYYYSTGIRFISRITTDASYGTIRHIDRSREDLLAVNHGTILQPNVTNDWVLIDSIACDPAKAVLK